MVNRTLVISYLIYNPPAVIKLSLAGNGYPIGRSLSYYLRKLFALFVILVSLYILLK